MAQGYAPALYFVRSCSVVVCHEVRSVVAALRSPSFARLHDALPLVVGHAIALRHPSCRAPTPSKAVSVRAFGTNGLVCRLARGTKCVTFHVRSLLLRSVSSLPLIDHPCGVLSTSALPLAHM